MEKIEAYTFHEVIEFIEKGETYRGYEYIISKCIYTYGINIKHVKKDFINWNDLQEDLFIKVKCEVI